MKKELKNRGLSTVGNKNELQERLQLAMIETDAALDPNISELLDEDVLNVCSHPSQEMVIKLPHEKYFAHPFRFFQDDELDEEDKSLLAEETSHIEDESLLSTSSHSTKADAGLVDHTVEPEKKIVLKRTAPITAPASSDTLDATKSENEDKSSPKVAKLSNLTAAERLELRTKKFGLTPSSTPVNTELKKQARAERFGLKTTNPTESDKTVEVAKPANNKIDTSNLGEVSVEVLKKRAERFGTVSSKLASVENVEKLAKRQDRFGVTAPTTTPAENANGSSKPTIDYEEKARLRLERFKQEVK